MRWSDVQFNPPARTLRQFAGLWLGFFAGLATVQVFWDRPVPAMVFAGLGLIVGLPGLARPAFVRPVYVAATLITFPIGWTVSMVILICLFFGVFTPVALLFRLLGREVLMRRSQTGRESYWTSKPMPTSVHRYFRPF
jgi:hypothetical protein